MFRKVIFVSELHFAETQDCSGLTSIEIPESVTSIGVSMFSGCSGLKSIKIPKNVTSIEEYAFEGCNNLTSIEIPESVTSIGKSVFEGCSSLTDIYYGGTKEQWQMIIDERDEYGEEDEEGIDESITTIHYGEKMPTTPSNPETPDQPGNTNQPNYDAVTLTTTTLVFDTIGETSELKLLNVPEGATVTWTTDNAQVATVENGKVTAVGNGTATITAKIGDNGEKVVTATITVSQKSESISLKLNGQAVKGTLKAKVKKSYALKAEVAPATVDTKNSKVTWTTSDAKVASVNENGKVSIKKAGKVTITATTADGKSASVTFKAEKKAVKVSKIKISGKNTMKVKKSQKLTVTVTPVTADNTKVTWKSSNPKVATVNSKGKVTAKKKGTVKITATAKDGSKKKTTITIKIK